MRAIDADEIIKVAEHAYHEWNLAMAAADTNRQVNLTYKMQDLCKAVKAVAEAAPTIDPESLRPQGEWEAYPSDQYRRCSHCKTEWEKEKIPRIANYCLYCGARMKGAGENETDCGF